MSQLDSQTKEIDGVTYRVRMLDPLTATDLLADIAQILGPSLGALGGMLAREPGDPVSRLLEGVAPGEETSIDTAIERAVVGFFQRFDKAKQREIIATMRKVSCLVLPNGKEPELSEVFSAHFQGRIKSLYLWLGFALRVQFQDFFSEGSAIGDVVQQVAEAASSYRSD